MSNNDAYQHARAEAKRLEAQLGKAYRDQQLYADLRPGELREIVETDRTGRHISRFVGDPGAAWQPFKLPLRIVTGFNTK
jgi:hypothetical protein